MHTLVRAAVVHLASPLARGVGRRDFLRLSAGVAGLGLIAACAPGPTTSSGAAPAAKTSSKVQLPTFTAAAGAKPDLAATADGVEAGYFAFPKDWFNAVQQTPSSGGSFTALTQTFGPPPTAMAQSTAWQEINKQLGLTLNLNLVAATDYNARLGTVLAGGDLPDLIQGSPSNIPSMPQFLQAQCADLTPYLSGDAIKNYPNLAGLPTLAWRSTVFNGGIFAVPNNRGVFSQALFANQDRVDAAGVGPIKTADDFTRLCKALTRPAANQFALGPAWNSQAGALGYFHGMFGVDNNWAESGGKLTKDIEQPQYKDTLNYLRSLVEANVVPPDWPAMNLTQARTAFYNGTLAMMGEGWTAAYQLYWDQAAAAPQPFHVRAMLPFAGNGATPKYFLRAGAPGLVVLKKASADRVQELLRVLDFIAAPFGSKQSVLLNYGVQGADFTLDANGNPALTDTGKAEMTFPWIYMVSPPQVLFDRTSPDFAKAAYADEQALLKLAATDPTTGLISNTWLSKAASLNQLVNDKVTDILAGRAAVSGWDELISTWRQQGGDQARTEFEKALAEAKA
jgi:putative aldouronate transport system substrate-binding protein